MTAKEIKDFQTYILSWYKNHQRNLPWRKTRNPYAIFVSEVMSQQTQINRVVPKYLAWMEKFPTIESLASASARDVLLSWSGLGYNRRALYLQKCAQEIVTRCNGVFPQTKNELVALPGIGEYTASAILCFAFNKQIAVIDTNIKKVILTHFCQNHPEHSEGSQKDKKRFFSASWRIAQNDKKKKRTSYALTMTNDEIKKIAKLLLPKGRASEWNQALMDYASSELKKEKIPTPKQSTFKNSNRYYRGQIIKLLLLEKSLSQEKLQNIFKEKLEKKRLEKILKTLVKDSLLTYKNNLYLLP